MSSKFLYETRQCDCNTKTGRCLCQNSSAYKRCQCHQRSNDKQKLAEKPYDSCCNDSVKGVQKSAANNPIEPLNSSKVLHQVSNLPRVPVKETTYKTSNNSNLQSTVKRHLLSGNENLSRKLAVQKPPNNHIQSQKNLLEPISPQNVKNVTKDVISGQFPCPCLQLQTKPNLSNETKTEQKTIMPTIPQEMTIPSVRQKCAVEYTKRQEYKPVEVTRSPDAKMAKEVITSHFSPYTRIHVKSDLGSIPGHKMDRSRIPTLQKLVIPQTLEKINSESICCTPKDDGASMKRRAVEDVKNVNKGTQQTCPCLQVNDDKIWERRFNKWWEMIKSKDQQMAMINSKDQEMAINGEKGLSGEPYTNLPTTQQQMVRSFKNDKIAAGKDEKKPKGCISKLRKVFKIMRSDFKYNDANRNDGKNISEREKSDICGKERKCTENKNVLQPCGEFCQCDELRQCNQQPFMCSCKPCFCSDDQHHVLFDKPVKMSGGQIMHTQSDEIFCDSVHNYPSVKSVQVVQVSEAKECIQEISYENIPEQGGCCCICDEAVCPCSCCIPEPINLRMQTSRFRLRENSTQTDKVKGKCCKCCRCCRQKNYCSDCVPKKDSCDDCGDCDDDDKKQNNPTGRLHQRNPTESIKQPNNPQHKTQQNTTKLKCASSKRKIKTLMVRSNSVQCIPETQNKETCCSYDYQFSCSRMNQFIHLLDDTESMNHQSHGDYLRKKSNVQPKNPKTTNTKLNTFFGEDGLYSNPKSFNGALTDVDKFLNIPKDHLTDLFQRDMLESTNFEHTNIMSAFCEAILSNRDNSNVKNVDYSKNVTHVDSLEDVKLDKTEKNNSQKETLEIDFLKRFEKLEEKINNLMKKPDFETPKSETPKSEVIFESPTTINLRKTNTKAMTNNLPRRIDDKKTDKHLNFISSKVPISRTGLLAAAPNRIKSKDKLKDINSRSSSRSSSVDSKGRSKNQSKQTNDQGDSIDEPKQSGLNKKFVDDLLTETGTAHKFLNLDHLNTKEREKNLDANLHVIKENGENVCDNEELFNKTSKENENTTNHLKIELKHLDFSGIKFTKVIDKNSPEVQSCSIAENLRSITSSISDTYSLRKIFDNQNCELIENTSSPILSENTSSPFVSENTSSPLLPKNTSSPLLSELTITELIDENR